MTVFIISIDKVTGHKLLHFCMFTWHIFDYLIIISSLHLARKNAVRMFWIWGQSLNAQQFAGLMNSTLFVTSIIVQLQAGWSTVMNTAMEECSVCTGVTVIKVFFEVYWYWACKIRLLEPNSERSVHILSARNGRVYLLDARIKTAPPTYSIEFVSM